MRILTLKLISKRIFANEGVGSDTHRLRLGGKGGNPKAEADPLIYDGWSGWICNNPIEMHHSNSIRRIRILVGKEPNS